MCVLFFFVALWAGPSWAQIYNDQTGQMIPGTQRITPGPGVDLNGWNTPGHELEFANLVSIDLTNASFATSDLTYASFLGSTLENSDFTNANLTNCNLSAASIDSANFSQANLTKANFEYATIEGDLSQANLTSADFSYATLNANLSGAQVQGTNFSAEVPYFNTRYGSLTVAQLVSTASYQNHNLTGINLTYNVLSGADLTGQNLTNAILSNLFFLSDLPEGIGAFSQLGLTIVMPGGRRRQCLFCFDAAQGILRSANTRRIL
jgi:uncharacterized protein YjbI with pentapeptide repeats